MAYRNLTLINLYKSLVNAGELTFTKKLRDGQDFYKGQILTVEKSKLIENDKLPKFVVAKVVEATTRNKHFNLRKGCMQLKLKVVHNPVAVDESALDNQ